MEIVIKIPKEFEEHFNADRFEDILQRARYDIHRFIIGNKNKFMLSGNREIETLDMLTEAFANGKPLERLIGTEILKAKQNITVGKEDYNMGIYVGLIKALNLFEDKEREE